LCLRIKHLRICTCKITAEFFVHNSEKTAKTQTSRGFSRGAMNFLIHDVKERCACRARGHRSTIARTRQRNIRMTNCGGTGSAHVHTRSAPEGAQHCVRVRFASAHARLETRGPCKMKVRTAG
jgi:hypothetical protein